MGGGLDSEDEDYDGPAPVPTLMAGVPAFESHLVEDLSVVRFPLRLADIVDKPETDLCFVEDGMWIRDTGAGETEYTQYHYTIRPLKYPVDALTITEQLVRDFDVVDDVG